MSIYKLVAFDLDGTLLNKNMILCKDTKKGLNYINSYGVKCAIITGRSINNIIPIFKKLPIEYLAGLNGAHIYNNYSKRTEYTKKIKQEYVTKILEYVTKNNLASNFFSEDKVYTTRFAHHKMTKIYQKTLKPINITKMKSQNNILSIQIMCNTSSESEYNLKTLKHIFTDKLSIENTGYNFLQISDKNILKSNALTYIAKKNNIILNETIAIGDSFSDISMIKSAGLGVGMPNGHKDFLKEVDIITTYDNSENGAINFLLKEIFNN